MYLRTDGANDFRFLARACLHVGKLLDPSCGRFWPELCRTAHTLIVEARTLPGEAFLPRDDHRPMTERQWAKAQVFLSLRPRAAYQAAKVETFGETLSRLRSSGIRRCKCPTLDSVEGGNFNLFGVSTGLGRGRGCAFGCNAIASAPT